MECINCGKRGHSFRECTEPITSFGIVALKFPKDHIIYSSEIEKSDVISHTHTIFDKYLKSTKDSDSIEKELDKEIKILMIMRKQSLGYVEFLRGKYKNVDLVKILMNQMTMDEREKLGKMEFDDLWDDLWSGQKNKQYVSELEYAKTKFQTIKLVGYEGKKLNELLSECVSTFSEPEWGFPKGRRSVHETEFSAALREFREETGWGLYRKPPYCLRDIPCIVEQYVGSNGIKYRQIYYIGICEPDSEVFLDEMNKVQTREVGNIGWFSFDEGIKKIRETSSEKINVIKQLNLRMDEIIEAYKSSRKTLTKSEYYGKRKGYSYSY